MSSAEHSDAEALPLVGPPVDRVDGPLKATGTAAYAADVSPPQLAHAVLVGSTVAAGRVLHISTVAAEAAPGVLAVITHRNAATLRRGPAGQRFMRGPVGQLVLTTLLKRASVGQLFMSTGSPAPPLQDDRILHYGQPVAVAVAETAEQATAAARLVQVDYDRGREPLLDLDDPRAELLTNPWRLDMKRGDVAAALESAEMGIEAAYTTPDQTNNPLGLFATVARWDGDRLTVHDSTQWPYGVRETLAAVFGVPEHDVRVLAPFVGGGFGAGLRVWPHVILAALAARTVNRPVKLVLTRPQMFTSVGHRPTTKQHVKLGATCSGALVAVDHEATASVALEDDNVELVAYGTAAAYACPNLQTRDRQVRLNVACPGSMRAPGTAQGNFALESAIDELAYTLAMDPLELRLRNYIQTDPQSGLPWSSNALRDCYIQGADRFGWSHRSAEPGSMRAGRLLVGYGMAGVTYQYYQAPCQARASVRRDGRAHVRSAATDIGTGTATVMTQLSAEILGLELDRVQFELGDTRLPMAPWQGGSGLTGALGTAVHQACVQLVQRFLEVVKHDGESPLKGCRLQDVAVAGGRIHRTDDPTRGEAYTDILARHQLQELTADGASATPRDFLLQGLASSAARLGRFVPTAARATGAHAPAGAFAAKFVEVHVDPDLGTVRVARVVSAIDGGRILNQKTATSQVLGGTVGGIGMALLEETLTDQGTGRIANATLGDYLVVVNADVPAMDVIFVGDPDPMTPIGTKGVGEIGLVGVAAAIANAVFHATGRRVRSLPIRPEQLL
jgi:CO/xanthine dehydrogenase Mo-binding subunit